jgi:hypothetical protein
VDTRNGRGVAHHTWQYETGTQACGLGCLKASHESSTFAAAVHSMPIS